MRIFDRTTLSPLLLESVLSNPTRGSCVHLVRASVEAGERTCTCLQRSIAASLLHSYLYSRFLPRQRGKEGGGAGEDAGGRSQRSLTLKATPCLHGTVFQRALCDPAKGKPQEETAGKLCPPPPPPPPFSGVRYVTGDLTAPPRRGNPLQKVLLIQSRQFNVCFGEVSYPVLVNNLGPASALPFTYPAGRRKGGGVGGWKQTGVQVCDV